MALQGSLSEFSVLETLQLIGLQKKTGRLEVTSGRIRQCLHFRDGLLIGCEATRPNDRDPFLAALAGLGQLGSEDERRYRASTSESPDLWSRLMESIPLEQETLEETRQLAMQATLDQVLLWNRGHFHFDADSPVPIGFAGWNTEQVLLESMRRLDEAADLKAGEFGLASVATALPGAQIDLESGPDDAVAASLERAFLARLDGRRTLGDLVKALGVAEYDVLNVARVLRSQRRIRLEVRGRAADGTQLLLEQPLRLRHPLLYVGAVMLAAMLLATGLVVHRATALVTASEAGAPQRADYDEGRDLRLALEVYQLRHGAYPARLDALVEAGLWTTPLPSSAASYRPSDEGRGYLWDPPLGSAPGTDQPIKR
ncbi:MAG: DUF4388 domain-containing protein [Candidatus Eisenbacteria bacterium]|nr:DUF4388 domain-containing protein [Candidatus Eisenbacteria bacterium]MCC7141810.1 DUF4388 domain-containing protein [Candidatus Eisenbacteria bacterium]